MSRVRGTLSLISIPSTPVTVVSLLLGYTTYNPSILTVDAVPLIAAGALGHWAFYAANDVYDYGWDLRQERSSKPLVRRDLSVKSAVFISLFLGAVSLSIAVLYFPALSILGWIAAMMLGFLYDVRSKEDEYAAFYMASWGVVIIFTGSIYAGGVTFATVIMALLLGVHMLWMTIMGDLKDVGQGERSIPERLDCRVMEDEGYKHLWTSARFNVMAKLIILAQIALLLLLPVGDGLHETDVMFAYMAVIAGVVVWETFHEVLYQPGFDRDDMKTDIAKYEIVSVTSVLIISMSFVNPSSIGSLFVGSVVWGLSWQAILYGHPLRFP